MLTQAKPTLKRESLQFVSPRRMALNTETHVYHKEGSSFYGTTAKGKYMSEADAIKEGDKAAHN
jgi:hypothetical protein